jgi:hypothetical protein
MLHLAPPFKHHNEAKRIIQEMDTKRKSAKKVVNGDENYNINRVKGHDSLVNGI